MGLSCIANIPLTVSVRNAEFDLKLFLMHLIVVEYRHWANNCGLSLTNCFQSSLLAQMCHSDTAGPYQNEAKIRSLGISTSSMYLLMKIPA